MVGRYTIAVEIDVTDQLETHLAFNDGLHLQWWFASS